MVPIGDRRDPNDPEVPTPTRSRVFRHDERRTARTSLPGNPLAPSAARRFVRAALAEWTSLGLLTTCALCQGDEACPPGRHSSDGLADDAVLIVDELVTNAVVHAGTNVELLCRLEAPPEPEADGPDAPGPDRAPGPDGAPVSVPEPDTASEYEPAALVIEVSDHHPARSVRSDAHGPEGGGAPDYGRGLQLIAALAERWGITYRTGLKTVWARLPLDGPTAEVPSGTDTASGVNGVVGEPALRRGLRAAEILAAAPRGMPREDPDWISRGALSFLAEASDLLAGQLDEDLVAALAGQLLVPRLADWCAIWLDGEGEGHGRAGTPRLARVWHADESRIELLRALLEKEPPRLLDSQPGQDGTGGGTGGRNVPVPVPWPGSGQTGSHDGAAVSCGSSPTAAPSAPWSSAGAGSPGCPTKSSRSSRTSPAASPSRSAPPAATPGRPPSAASCNAACCPARSPGSRASRATSCTSPPTTAWSAATSTTSSRRRPAVGGASCSATSRAAAPRPPSSPVSPGPGCGSWPVRGTASARCSTGSTGFCSTTRWKPPRPPR